MRDDCENGNDENGYKQSRVDIWISGGDCVRSKSSTTNIGAGLFGVGYEHFAHSHERTAQSVRVVSHGRVLCVHIEHFTNGIQSQPVSQ